MSVDAALSILALALSAGALACGMGAVFARAVPAAASFLAGAAAFGATAAVVSGAEDAGLALMLVIAIWGPLLLLAVMVLSSRTMKATPAPQVLSGALGLTALSAPIAWGAIELPPMPQTTQDASNIAPWLASLAFTAAVVSVSSLGYGERGVLGARHAARLRLDGPETLGRSAQLVGAVLVFFACLLLWTRASGGVGFAAGLLLVLAITLHALVNGSRAVMALTPLLVLRVALFMGVLAAAASLMPGSFPFASTIAEAGAFACVVGAGTMIIFVLFGRAPTLRETDA